MAVADHVVVGSGQAESGGRAVQPVEVAADGERTRRR